MTLVQLSKARARILRAVNQSVYQLMRICFSKLAMLLTILAQVQQLGSACSAASKHTFNRHLEFHLLRVKIQAALSRLLVAHPVLAALLVPVLSTQARLQ